MAQGNGARRWTFRTTPQRKMMFAVGLVVALLGAMFAAMAPGASAATSIDPITSGYDVYPDASLIPDTCHVDGANVLVGAKYDVTHNGSTSTFTDIGAAALETGDKVKLYWTDYTAGCENIGISLAVKSTPHPDFVLADNQHLVDSVFCSGDDCGTGDAKGNLTITIPALTDACNFQFDAIIGPPLSVVGPSGSYYNNVSRKNASDQGLPDNPINTGGANMLIGGRNGGVGECLPPPVSASQSCGTVSTAELAAQVVLGPNVDVAITAPTDDSHADTIVDVLKDGVVTDAAFHVAYGTTGHVHVPFAVNETATISVVDTLWGEVFSQPFTFDCVNPGATITNSCSADTNGTVISFTNTGESPADFEVTKNGSVIDTVTVAGGGTETRTYAMNEDETSTFRVTSTDYDSGDVSITHDCVQVEATTTTTATTVPDTVQGIELARTGAGSTTSFTMLSGALLLLGGILMALANRPLPKTAAASSSRGR